MEFRASSETKMDNLSDTLLKHKSSSDFKLTELENRLILDESEYNKLRMNTKATVRTEIEKLASLSAVTKDEFIRVNSYIDVNFKLIKLLMEDSMINHLLLE